MKKNNIYISLMVFILAFVTSCQDAIDVLPKDEITESSALETVDDIEDAVTGVYAAISGSNLISWNSRFSDNLKKGAGNRGQGVQVHTWSIVTSTNEPDGLWRNMYLVINRANRILAVIDNIPTNSSADASKINVFKGELLTIRALMHFDLARLFSTSYTDLNALAVPYVDFPVVLEKPARNTLGEVYTNIENDLIEASSLISSSSRSNIYVTPDVIPALKARVALYKNTSADNTVAINNATTVINNNSISSISNMPSVWTDDSEQGVIFKLKRTPTNFAVGTLFTDTNGDVFFSPAKQLMDLYTSNDARKSSYFASSDEVGKYLGTSSVFGLNDIKMFRVAEQYLIRAEAYARENMLTEAAADYNMVRKNRISSYTDESFANKTEALNKIREERRRELAYEGHRFFDLKRDGLPVTRLADDCAPNSFACDLPASSHKFTLPIPQTEIFANPNIADQQNPGYN
ncbi:RagB/SusD family nutrient uptake outer membrane protein [Tenacibaculum crassostreae]|uniref:RagB/SusD family nutrient uptake outer membrane protein n=1 Tax=Tenacibaculum crassostreae TaxID=502683 RepID=UPI00389413F5